MALAESIHEVDFCSQIASAINILISQNPEIYPFSDARVEGYGSGTAKAKRKDLRFYDKNGKLCLCGEVKMPGTVEGQSPYNPVLREDAMAKADNAGVRHCFTWNVNVFVLWDRAKWDVHPDERRIKQWELQRQLATAEDVAKQFNLEFIKTHFVPDLLRDLAEIISGRRSDWATPLDAVFINSLNSHLDWPYQLLTRHILEHANRDRSFNTRALKWLTDNDFPFVTSPHEQWVKAVETMAKTLCYVWANRIIFYKALRSRFPDLPRLDLRASIKKSEDALNAFNQAFARAVERSGDYESLLMPGAADWATGLVFQPVNALDAWRGLLRGLESVDFKQVPSDIVGRIFQKLISPEERHRYGQHFTGDDVVDLINSFCIRNASDTVLDPSCGSGSFLVRAYYRKRHLDHRRPHLDLVGELFGCDIAMYPAHLATMNLAARDIQDEANYPRIARRDFLAYAPTESFCDVPVEGKPDQHIHIRLPRLDAVVGNPPYVRQEMVEEKKRYSENVKFAWPGMELSGRSDLHCYFWPLAARLLKADGYFGFLTSSSWMDVDYGFALQGWMLRHFKILAVMETAAEPWFEDARVKTCVAILQRWDSDEERMDNLVRFIRFKRKLADIIGVSASHDEDERQRAVEALRNRILSAKKDTQNQDIRIVIKGQRDLWEDGIRAGKVLAGVKEEKGVEDEEYDDAPVPKARAGGMFGGNANPYRAGKWGRYVRAPDFYFEMMKRFSTRFVPLGEIADIRFGVKTGCDAFFMPKDVTAEYLESYPDEKLFQRHAGAPRKEVASGKLRLIRDGARVVHGIEAKYVKPEVHSLMKVDRPVVTAADLDRVVLMVGEPIEKIKDKAPWAYRYLQYGRTATFASKKSKPVPVPKRSTCAARDPWYDLTGLVKPGIVFWPMSQQYRHIIAANPESLICNHNLFDLAANELSAIEARALVAVLNSTVVALFKTFYGRYAGTEGNLKTEVVDVNLLEIPDPRGVPTHIAKRLEKALSSMCKRDVGRLVEEQLMECHTPERAQRIGAGPLVLSEELQQPDRRELDDAVFEMLGVKDAAERTKLIERLYKETAQHFREIRIVEIAKMEQRAKSETRRFNTQDLAADIWDAAGLEDARPIAEWIEKEASAHHATTIPEEQPVKLSDDVMFAPNVVYFGRARATQLEARTRAEAELITQLANFGVSGTIQLPKQTNNISGLVSNMNMRLEAAKQRFALLAESRTSDDVVQKELIELLMQWFVLGRTNKQ
jgi:hypothetical protein